MATNALLRGRVRGTTMNLCRLFGVGLGLDDSKTGRAVDALLLSANLAFGAFGFHHVTSAVQISMPLMWDIATVMSVVKVYTYVLTPPVTLVMWHLNKRRLADLVRRLDDVVPPSVGRLPLKPFARYAAAWFVVSVSVEWLVYTLFHLDTGFAFFQPYEYPMIVVYNAWTAVPMYAYVFLVDTVRLAVRHINGRITSVGAWTAHRDRWQELARTATRLANRDFGVIIVVFVVSSIAEVVFYSSLLYFVSYKTEKSYLDMSVHAATALFNACWMFEVFRVSLNCKCEMQKTQLILNSVKIATEKDYKELKHASLYMLHMDFNFVPCDIFEMSYRSLVTIATLITAFLIFQIQMKLNKK